MKPLCLLPVLPTLAACGFKGAPYLPHENGKNRFGIIQTGLETSRSPAASEPSRPIDFRRPNASSERTSQK